MDALRWSTVPYCLAALALATPALPRTPAPAEQPSLELPSLDDPAAPVRIAEVDDVPPDPPRPTTRWRGTCAETSALWNTPIRLALEASTPDDQLFVTGELAFADRRVSLATGEGDAPLPSPERRLFGNMIEIGGLGTTWDVLLFVERLDRTHFAGALYEGNQLICRFAWRR